MIRRLAAVAFADLAGYSAMVEVNDRAAVELWHGLFSDILDPPLKRHRGQALRTQGDSVLIEFASVVDAANWSLDVQRSLTELKSGPALGARLRIAINVEDVIFDGRDLHGDGVNVAARIHQLAQPGEVVVTAAVRDYLVNKLDVGTDDLGEYRVKHLSRPIRVYRMRPSASCDFAGPATAAFSQASNGPSPQPATGPMVAVLPFSVPQGSEEDRYFGEGITEDIIAHLSRDRSIVVLARHTTLTLPGLDSDPARAAGRLGAGYVLSGSLRRQRPKLRILANLVEVSSGKLLWSGRFDGEEKDLFDFQDRIASSVAVETNPRIQAAEVRRVLDKPTGDLDAYDFMLRALPLLYTFRMEEFLRAGQYLDCALERDPGFARAHAYKAWWYVLALGESRRTEDPRRDARLAEEAIREALALDRDDAFTLAVAGHVYAFLRNAPLRGLEMFDRALQINPNLAFAWGVSGSTLSFLGRGAEALSRLAEADRLSPRDALNFFFHTIAGLACFVEGRLDEALTWLDRALLANRRFVAALRLRCVVLGLLGRVEAAQAARAELQSVYPGFDAERFVRWYPLQRLTDRERLADGLLAAGFEVSRNHLPTAPFGG